MASEVRDIPTYVQVNVIFDKGYFCPLTGFPGVNKVRVNPTNFVVLSDSRGGFLPDIGERVAREMFKDFSFSDGKIFAIIARRAAVEVAEKVSGMMNRMIMMEEGSTISPLTDHKVCVIDVEVDAVGPSVRTTRIDVRIFISGPSDSSIIERKLILKRFLEKFFETFLSDDFLGRDDEIVLVEQTLLSTIDEK